MKSLRIPRSTLSDWFSKEDWSNKIRVRLTAAAQIEHTARLVELDRVRGSRLDRIYEEARAEAKAELVHYRYNPLFIAGLMLYWGEGDKLSKYTTRLSNTDPALIKLYVTFLEKACRIPAEKIRAGILTYPDLDPDRCKQYWSCESGIAPERFIKCVEIQGRHKTRRLAYGVCTVYISSTYFKIKMLEWLKLLPRELMNKGYYENIEPEADIV